MAIALGQHTFASSGATNVASLTTSAVATNATGSTFVALVDSTASFGTGTVADSFGNTYVLEQSQLAIGGGGARSNVWVCQNGSGGSGHTFTATPQTSQGLVIAFIEITGAQAASLDQNSSTTGSSASAATPSVTTLHANELLLALFGTGGNSTLSAPTNGFTLGDQGTLSGSNQVTGGWSSDVVSATGNYSTAVTISASHGWAASILTFIAAASGSAPVKPTDLPAPTKKTSIFPDWVPNLLATTLAILAPFHQTDWQTPLAARPIRTDVAPNTLIAGIPQALGFNQYDWPLPAARARAVPQADSSGNQLLQGIPQQMGFNVSDWPTPAKARLAPLVNPVPNNLALGIPQALGFNQSDWVTPQRPQAIRFDDAPNVLITIPNAAAPFAQVDWITPQRARAAPQDLQQAGLLTLASVPPAPFAQVDWITPQRARAAPQDLQQAGQTTRGIVPPAPLLPVDLPTPAGRAALRLDDPPNLLAGALQGAPFAQVDWITPQRARAAPQDAPQAGLLTLASVAPAPFTAADVGAVSYRPRPALLPEPVQNALILGLPPVMGANQSDWPQPYRARMAPPWGDAPNATIIQPAAAAFPFGLADWPTPRAAQTLWDVHFIWQNSQLPPIPPPPPALTFSIDPLPIPLYTDWQGVSKAERAKIRRIEKKLKRLRGEYVKAEQQQLAAAHRGARPQPAAMARHAALDRDITALAAALERVALRSMERDEEEALIVQWDADERSVSALLAEVAALLAKGDT